MTDFLNKRECKPNTCIKPNIILFLFITLIISHPSASPATRHSQVHTHPHPTFCEKDVRQLFRRQKIMMLPGCADQLPPIFTLIFDRSLELCEVPCCFKRSTIIPVPKEPSITGLMTTGLCPSRL